MVENNGKRELILQLAGWILFIVCGFFFIVPGIQHRDGWMIAGCVCFLGGCVLFVVPLIEAIRHRSSKPQ